MLRTKFRVANCYVSGTEYSPAHVDEFAITEDGKKHIVHETADGEKYFYPENPFANDARGRHFFGRVGDAIRAIDEGYADCLIVGGHTNVFNSYTKPVVMIDRIKGEEYQAKAKDGFKDTEIGYVIKFYGKNSLGPSRSLDADGIPVVCWETPKIYETEDKAKEFLSAWLDKAKGFAIKYSNAKEDAEKEKLCKEVPEGIVCDVFFDILEYNKNHNKLLVRERDDLSVLDTYGWNIEQEILRHENF